MNKNVVETAAGKTYTIYSITHKQSGRSYVGCTSMSLKARWNCHQSASRAGSQCLLHQAIRQFGKSAFTIKELDKTDDEDFAFNVLEPCHISAQNSFIYGFNRTRGGRGGLSGFKHSAASRKSQGEKLANTKWMTDGVEEKRAKKGQRLKKGWRWGFSDAHKLRVSAGKLGKSRSKPTACGVCA